MILRKSGLGKYELLAHQFKTAPHLPLRMPGGGVDEGETPDEGVLREIEEESGLKPESLVLLRKLGVHHYFKPYIHAHVERHDYLFLAPEDTPDAWDNVVTGNGEDANETFCYSWIGAEKHDKIDEELTTHITRDHIPELFD